VQTAERDLVDENLRVSGAVIGESIIYNAETGALHFMIADIPTDEDQIAAQGGLESVLHQAVLDPDAARLEVVHHGPPPDMLKEEAQAILTGTLQADGSFLAEEILLKCPSKYEEVLPEQVVTAQP
jgi:cytochrome c-type biogenesis protein CcmE